MTNTSAPKPKPHQHIKSYTQNIRAANDREPHSKHFYPPKWCRVCTLPFQEKHCPRCDFVPDHA